MDKKEFRDKMCICCVNYSEPCQEEEIREKVIDGVKVIRCKNYHKWTDCVTKNCNTCGKCK